MATCASALAARENGADNRSHVLYVPYVASVLSSPPIFSQLPQRHESRIVDDSVYENLYYSRIG